MNTYTLHLDKERSLKYSNRSFRELEKRSGIAVLSKLQELSEGKLLTLDYITQFIWAGLLHESVPFETVIDIVPVNKYTDLVTFIAKVVSEEYGLGDATEKKTKKSKSVTTGNGTPSKELHIAT